VVSLGLTRQSLQEARLLVIQVLDNELHDGLLVPFGAAQVVVRLERGFKVHSHCTETSPFVVKVKLFVLHGLVLVAWLDGVASLVRLSCRSRGFGCFRGSSFCFVGTSFGGCANLGLFDLLCSDLFRRRGSTHNRLGSVPHGRGSPEFVENVFYRDSIFADFVKQGAGLLQGLRLALCFLENRQTCCLLRQVQHFGFGGKRRRRFVAIRRSISATVVIYSASRHRALDTEVVLRLNLRGCGWLDLHELSLIELRSHLP
jgi:hypothetical protein